MSLPLFSGNVPAARNSVLLGDCTAIMNELPAHSVDFILTDPPYIMNYRPRSGQRVANDNNADWLYPSAAEMYRLLKPGGYCVSFYGWNKAHVFIDAWHKAGFRIVGHFAFCKRYATNANVVRNQHECAYLLAKGKVDSPANPIPDVIDFPYSGNRLHPTEKPVAALLPLIESFSRPGDVVFDPFCGSGSTLDAARSLGRDWLGIELDAKHHRTASYRMH